MTSKATSDRSGPISGHFFGLFFLVLGSVGAALPRPDLLPFPFGVFFYFACSSSPKALKYQLTTIQNFLKISINFTVRSSVYSL